jgi:SAM-dependent methyltransferase
MKRVDEKKSLVTVVDVKSFWEEHPLLGYELPYEPGSPEFFVEYDKIREDEEFKYCFHLLGLKPELKGKDILDVGCGNGWLLSKYAAFGLNTTGVDLTMRAIEISSTRFRNGNLKGRFINASAEALPFADNRFDIATSLGVIHHTPKTELAAKELIRVCKPGGRVLIAVYYENLLVKKWFYPLTRLALRFMGRRDLFSLNRQAFINRYDGPDNPLGKVYNKRQAMELLDDMKDLKCEVHYFPKRFVPRLKALKFIPLFDRFLDKTFGFLIYVEGNKPLA